MPNVNKQLLRFSLPISLEIHHHHHFKPQRAIQQSPIFVFVHLQPSNQLKASSYSSHSRLTTQLPHPHQKREHGKPQTVRHHQLLALNQPHPERCYVVAINMTNRI